MTFAGKGNDTGMVPVRGSAFGEKTAESAEWVAPSVRFGNSGRGPCQIGIGDGRVPRNGPRVDSSDANALNSTDGRDPRRFSVGASDYEHDRSTHRQTPTS